jgi:lysophospholipase L1-like esterase
MKAPLPQVKRTIVFGILFAVFALTYTFMYPDANHKVLSEEAVAPPPQRTVKIMPLGDSITAGSEPEYKNGYRLHLLNIFKDYKIDYVGGYKEGLPSMGDHDTQAQSGACIRATPCTSSMFEQTPSWIRGHTPDIVIMQGGTNDFSRGREHQDPQIVRNAMRDWVQSVWSAKPDAYIVVLGMPDYQSGYKNWIPVYVAYEKALGRPIDYVSLDGVEIPDGIHPDLKGYETIAKRLEPILRPVIARIAAQP